jgi:hypothetical protein
MNLEIECIYCGDLKRNVEGTESEPMLQSTHINWTRKELVELEGYVCDECEGLYDDD